MSLCLRSALPVRFIFVALVCLLLSAGPVAAQPVTHSNIDTYAKLVTAINTAHTNNFADIINITADITLEASLPQIERTVTINGDGGRNFIINGDGKYRPFNITSNGILTLNDLTIANAYIARASGTTPHGASIRNKGELTLNRVVVRNGKTDPDTSSGQHAVGAGGIYIEAGIGVVKIKDSAIYNNRSRGEGTGIRITNGNVTIVNTSIFGNTSSHGRGGGIYLGGGTLHLYHSTITNNTPNSSGESNLGNQAGGGIRVYGGTLTMVNNIIFGNTSDDCAIRTDSSVTITQIAGNIIESGSTSNCTSGQTTDDPDLAGPFGERLKYYIPRSGSPAIDAISSCITSAINGLSLATDQRGQPRPRLPGNNCDIGAIEHAGYVPPPPPPQPPPGEQPPPPSSDDGGGSGGGSGDSGSSQREAPRGALAPTSTCLLLGPEVVVNDASVGTACQVVEPGGYGHSDLGKAMPSKVVDVWGWVTPDTEVCFKGGGSIKFVDTMASPRTISTLPAVGKDGMVCAMIKDAGQVAHVPGPAPSQAQDPAPQAVAQSTAIPSRSLSDCMVKANYLLNMRDAPAGAKIGEVAWNATLTALERTPGWFKVDNMGAQGWIAAMYVEAKGTCD